MIRDDSLWIPARERTSPCQWQGRSSVLENVFEDFLRFFFKDAEEIFDMEKGFQYLDKELDQIFPTDDMSYPRFVDKLIKAYTLQGNEEWILLHIEVQGYTNQDEFEERMFTYFHRVKDRYGKPVVAIALLTDHIQSLRPVAYRYSCLGTHLVYRFNILKIMDLQEEKLLKSNNPFAVVLLTVLLAVKEKKGMIPSDLLDLKMELARNLVRKKFSTATIRSLMTFLKLYVRFDDQKLNTKFEDEIALLTNKKVTMGIEEFVLYRAEKKGREEGMQKGKQEGKKEGVDESKTLFVQNLLQQTDFSISKIASLVDVSEDFVIEIKKRA